MHHHYLLIPQDLKYYIGAQRFCYVHTCFHNTIYHIKVLKWHFKRKTLEDLPEYSSTFFEKISGVICIFLRCSIQPVPQVSLFFFVPFFFVCSNSFLLGIRNQKLAYI